MRRSGKDLDGVYLEYVEPIRNYLCRLSGDEHLAEDLAQEVFFRAYSQVLRGVKVQFISAWLYRIARNLFLDHSRRAGQSQASASETGLGTLEADWGRPEEETLRRETWGQIRVALRSLPEAHRTALILRDFQGLSYREVAEAMGVTLAAVKVRIHRARKAFIEFYDGTGGEHSDA